MRLPLAIMGTAMRRREFLALAGAVPLSAAAGPVPAASKLAADPHRPQYHLLPAANWMNDPNAPIYWQDKYHMFYQYNPNGAFWGDMHWAHAVSEDMVHWKHLPMALAPTPGGPDKDGVFSGCAVIDNGVPTAIYTGVNPETQSIATSAGDLTVWKKFSGNPAIAAPPAGMEVTGFRDPAVWKEGDTWLMALGSGFRGKGGAVPPHGPAMLLQRLGNGFGARAIFASVTDEDVAHRMAGPGRVSLLATRAPGPFCCSAPKAALRSPGARSGSRARTPAAAVTTAALAEIGRTSRRGRL